MHIDTFDPSVYSIAALILLVVSAVKPVYVERYVVFCQPALALLCAAGLAWLARLIARCALARAESRGAHLRQDHPERDPALDHRHAVIAADGTLHWQTWE